MVWFERPGQSNGRTQVYYCRVGATGCDSLKNVSSSSGNAKNPQVGAYTVVGPPDTNYVYVLYQDDNDGSSPNEIYFKASSNNGGSFGGRVNVSNTATNSRNPAMSVRNNGNIHLIWQDGGLQYCRYNNNNSTCTTTDTAAASGNSARLAAEAGNNDVHLVYVTSTGVFYQKRAGGVWGDAITLSGAVNGGAPVIAVDDDSPRNVHVVWHEYPICGAECDWELYYARSTDDGATFPQSPKSNFSRNQYTSYDPAVTARGSKIVMTWQENVNGAHPDIVFSRSNDNGGTWDAPPESAVPTPTAYNTAVPTATRTSTPTPGAGATWTPSPTPTAVTIASGITKYYYFGAQRIAMRNNTGLYYMHGDQLGSTSVVVNNSGVLVSRQTYYPFGMPRTSEGTALTSLTDFTFTGQKVDTSTGLMFYGARYYDAELGRFTQADTIVPGANNPQNMNRYSYVRNNPMRYGDPTGHIPCKTPEDCDENPPNPSPAPTVTPEPGEGCDPSIDPTCNGNEGGGSDCPEPDPSLCHDDGKDKDDDAGETGICGLDPSEIECDEYKIAIQEVKDLCLIAIPTCYDETIWFLVDIGMRDPAVLGIIEVEAAQAYSEQGLDLALIVDQNIDNPLQIGGSNYAVVTILNSRNTMMQEYVKELNLDDGKMENYEQLFLMKHIAKDHYSLYEAVKGCASDPFCRAYVDLNLFSQ